MELRRATIIQELEFLGFYESRDGKSLRALSLNELEVERIRLPEVREINNDGIMKLTMDRK